MTDRFLSRWSRRKNAARTAEPVPNNRIQYPPENPVSVTNRVSEEATDPVSIDAEESLVSEPHTESQAEDRTEEDIEREAEALGRPPIASLGPGSDFKAFMASEVPGHIRTLALRKLWGTNPVLANLDGLIDYGEDFTDAATVVKNFHSAWEVGRGYKRDPDQIELDDEENAEDLEEDLETTDVAQAGAEPLDSEEKLDHAAEKPSDNEGNDDAVQTEIDTLKSSNTQQTA